MIPIDKNKIENAIIEPVELDCEKLYMNCIIPVPSPFIKKELTFRKIKINNNNNPNTRENLYKNPVLKSPYTEKCLFLNIVTAREIISGFCFT